MQSEETQPQEQHHSADHMNLAECPDWVLDHLTHSTSLKLEGFKLICRCVKDTLDASQEHLFDERFFAKLQLQQSFSINDVRALYAAIDYIARCVKYKGLSLGALKPFLEQLDLPNEYSDAVCQLFEA